MKIFNWLKSFKKPKYDLTFVDIIGESWVHYHPIRAKDLKPLKEYQTEKYMIINLFIVQGCLIILNLDILFQHGFRLT